MSAAESTPSRLFSRFLSAAIVLSRGHHGTKVETLRKTYGDDFASGYRADAQLGTVLKREGLESLDQLVKKTK